MVVRELRHVERRLLHCFLPQLLALYCTQLQPSCKWNRVTDLLKIAVRDAAICPHTDTKN